MTDISTRRLAALVNAAGRRIYGAAAYYSVMNGSFRDRYPTLCLLLGIAWASPWTLLGLLLGAPSLVFRGGVRRTGRVVEFWGGLGGWLLQYVFRARAITFGHTVLARSVADLDTTHEHELVHVRQYERWGLLMVPAYLLYGLILWLRGRSPYFDNPFERQAFEEAD